MEKLGFCRRTELRNKSFLSKENNTIHSPNLHLTYSLVSTFLPLKVRLPIDIMAESSDENSRRTPFLSACYQNRPGDDLSCAPRRSQRVPIFIRAREGGDVTGVMAERRADKSGAGGRSWAQRPSVQFLASSIPYHRDRRKRRLAGTDRAWEQTQWHLFVIPVSDVQTVHLGSQCCLVSGISGVRSMGCQNCHEMNL